MPAFTGANLQLIQGWDVGDGAWGPLMNLNLARLDALVSLSVYSATAVTPASTVDGARYIVPASGTTGVFVGKENQLAVRAQGAWAFYVPFQGLTARVQDSNREIVWNGTLWTDALPRQPFLKVANPGAWTMPNGATWTKVQLFTVGSDTHSGWNASTYVYRPLFSGMYIVTAMLRPLRTGTNNMPSGTNICLGFGTTAADSVDVMCDTATDANPFTVSFSKVMFLSAGTDYFIFGKHTAAGPVAFTYAELSMVRVSS